MAMVDLALDLPWVQQSALAGHQEILPAKDKLKAGNIYEFDASITVILAQKRIKIYLRLWQWKYFMFANLKSWQQIVRNAPSH